MHAFFSLSLLSPAYYDKYFDDVGQLNLQGEIALSVGVVGKDGVPKVLHSGR